MGNIPLRRKWQPTPGFLPGKSKDKKVWQAPVLGVAKSWTQLSDWTTGLCICWDIRRSVKVESQETPGVTGKFGLGVQNEAGQRLIKFCQENALVIANTLFQQHKRRFYTWASPDGQHQIRLIILFAAKDGEALYSQQKQDRELTVVQFMNSLLPYSDWNWRKWRKPLDHSDMT